jgi:hypothetical protein
MDETFLNIAMIRSFYFFHSHQDSRAHRLVWFKIQSGLCFTADLVVPIRVGAIHSLSALGCRRDWRFSYITFILYI